MQPERATPIPSRRGLDDPRALDILTTEHWSLLSTRSLGYQEMIGRATVFISIVAATIVALALLAQATRFGRETLSIALLLLLVALLIGVATFVRCVVISFEDARWVAGMSLVRKAYLEIVPALAPYFVTGHEPLPDRRGLAHGAPQRLRNLANSLTTIAGVVAALDSLLAGTLAAGVAAQVGARTAVFALVGAAVSVVSAVMHVRGAARFRRRHDPVQ